jgi:hypothetical protein
MPKDRLIANKKSYCTQLFQIHRADIADIAHPSWIDDRGKSRRIHALALHGNQEEWSLAVGSAREAGEVRQM